MAGTDSSGVGFEHGQQSVKTIPKDALTMASILKEMGVNEYEPRVINQMLEFSYRYITDVLEDARVYSFHACRKQIDLDDVVMSVERRLDHSFTSPPPREFLLEAAKTKNSQSLPLIQEKSGLRLPPDRYCLTGSNYRLKTGNLTQRKTSHLTQKMHVSGASQKVSSAVSHGNTGPKTAGAIASAVNFATSRQGSSGFVSSNNHSITRETIDQLNMAKAVKLGYKETPMNMASEKREISSTVASLPSMEETAASAQKFPNLLKRKHEDEEDRLDS